jgi:hypothetical protein
MNSHFHHFHDLSTDTSLAEAGQRQAAVAEAMGQAALAVNSKFVMA